MPGRSVAEALVEALEPIPAAPAAACSSRAPAEARDVLPDALGERGAEVDVVALYDTRRRAPLDDARLAAAQAADYVTFTSSSTVRNFFAARRRTVHAPVRASSRSGR